MNTYFIGESCICWELGTALDRDTSAQVLRLYRAARRERDAGRLDVLDIVPSYSALAVYFDPVATDVRALRDSVEAVFGECDAQPTVQPPGRKVILPVNYDGPDMELSRDEVVRLHSQAEYTVAMIGFLPHFPYLIGLDKRLATPRLDKPRTRVPAGSVAIGGEQTGVYPRESPGGWNIIGTTDPRLLLSLVPGDSVVFTKR
jgi:KipI family sensor histidine kinase inhibitor